MSDAQSTTANGAGTTGAAGTMFASPRFLALLIAFIVLAILPPVANDVSLTSLVAKMMIFAIAAASLDLIMGYGGMVSFGHAVYLGIGGYAVGVLAKYGITDGYLQFFVAIVGSAFLALLIGLLSIRTTGLYFIMITFAFSQMVYFLGISLEPLGGDDGLPIDDRSDFWFFSLGQNVLGKKDDPSPDNVLVYYACLVALVITVFLLRRFVNSRFGMVIRGAHSNEDRMKAIGFPTFRYKLTSFVIAGAFCGVAGALWANHQSFLTPDYIQWIRSGDILIMVLIGGMGTIYGPVIGAFLFFILEDLILKKVNFSIGPINYVGEDHWPLLFGPILIFLVFFARNGVMSIFDRSNEKEHAVSRLLRSVFAKPR